MISKCILQLVPQPSLLTNNVAVLMATKYNYVAIHYIVLIGTAYDNTGTVLLEN